MVDIGSFMGNDLSFFFDTLNCGNSIIVSIVRQQQNNNILPILSRNMSFVIFSNDVGMDMVRLIAKLNGDKYVVATNSITMMQSISSYLTPDRVSFFCDANVVYLSAQIEQLMQRGYRIIRANLMTKKEGALRKILNASVETVFRARNRDSSGILKHLPLVLKDLTEEMKEIIIAEAIKGNLKVHYDNGSIHVLHNNDRDNKRDP